MYYAIPPSTKLAEKMVSCFIRELDQLKRKPQLTKAEIRHMRDLRKAAIVMRQKQI